jgi:hypothetical protein
MCLCNGYGCSNCEPWFYDNDAAQEEHGTGGTDKQQLKAESCHDIKVLEAWRTVKTNYTTNWTDATIELPAISQHVILSINGVVQEETFYLDMSDNEFYNIYFWDRDGLDNGLEISKGQFWMPLPSPPSI